MDAKNARINKFEDNSGNYLEQEKINAKGTVQRVQDEGASQVDATKAASDKWLSERQRRLDKVVTGRKQAAEKTQEAEISKERAATGELADVQQSQFETMNTGKMKDAGDKYEKALKEILAEGGDAQIPGKDLGDELQKLAPLSATKQPINPRMSRLVDEIKTSIYPGENWNSNIKYRDLVEKWRALNAELSKNPTQKGVQENKLLDTMRQKIFDYDPTAEIQDNGTVAGKMQKAVEGYSATSSEAERDSDILSGVNKKVPESRAIVQTRTAEKISKLGETSQDIVKPSHFQELTSESRAIIDPVRQRHAEELSNVEAAKKRFFDSIQSDKFRAEDVMGRSKDIAKSKEIEAKYAADERVSSVKLGSERDLADKKHNVSLAKRRIQESEDAKIESATEEGRKNIERKKAEGQSKLKSVESQSAQELADAEAAAQKNIRAKKVKEDSSLKTASGGLEPNTITGSIYHGVQSLGKVARSRGAVALDKVAPVAKASQSQLLNPNLRDKDSAEKLLNQAKAKLDGFTGNLKNKAESFRKKFLGLNAEEQAKMIKDMVAQHGSVGAGVSAAVEEEGTK
jgi:hypothetical protein